MWSYIQNADFTLGYFLFAAVKLIKNANPDKHSYFRSGIYDEGGSFSLSDSSGFGQNVFIFGGYMKLLVYVGNKLDSY